MALAVAGSTAVSYRRRPGSRTVSRETRPARRSLSAGRPARHHRSRDRAEADRGVGPERCRRQPSRRRRQHRRRSRREIAAGRLHDRHGRAVDARGQSEPVPAMPYDAVKDFAPITLVAVTPNVLVVNPALPVKSVQELIAYAKANPNKLSFGSGSNGSAGHLAGELFKVETGTDIVHIPYKGAAPAMQALLAGDTQLMFDNLASAMPQVKAGKLRALAVTTAKRSSLVPELPTMAEAGVPGFDISTWFGLLAPAGTPKDVVAKWNAEVAKILDSPEMRRAADRAGRRAGADDARAVRGVHRRGAAEVRADRQGVRRARGSMHGWRRHEYCAHFVALYLSRDAAARRAARGRAGAGVSDEADPHRRALPAGRRDRHPRARCRPEAHRSAGASRSSSTTAPAPAATSAPSSSPRPRPTATRCEMGTVGTHAINASLYAKMPYDHVKDFVPVILVAGVPERAGGESVGAGEFGRRADRATRRRTPASSISRRRAAARRSTFPASCSR